MEEYFEIKIVHFCYERSDLPNYDNYFDQEYDLLPYLKTKDYLISVRGNQSDE